MSDPAQAWERFRAARVFPSIDGLRALSIMAVLLLHCSVPLPGILGERGSLGVALFFTISGFLITTLLLREKDEFGSISLRNFYLRRALRIFPLYYAVLLAFCLATLAFDRHSEPGRVFWRHLPFFLLYMNNWVIALGPARVIFAPSWSLATEEQFYLFWPSILALARRRRTAIAVISLLMIWTWTMQALLGNGLLDLGPVPNRILTSVQPSICMGCLLAFALNDRRSFGWLYRILGWRGAPAAWLLAMIGLSMMTINVNVVSLSMVALLGSVVIRQDHGLRALLQNRLVRHTGVVSYGIYLMFTFVLNVGVKVLHLNQPYLLFAWTATVTLGVATVVYRYYETPFLRLKGRFAPVGRRARAPSADLADRPGVEVG